VLGNEHQYDDESPIQSFHQLPDRMTSVHGHFAGTVGNPSFIHKGKPGGERTNLQLGDPTISDDTAIDGNTPGTVFEALKLNEGSNLYWDGQTSGKRGITVSQVMGAPVAEGEEPGIIGLQDVQKQGLLDSLWSMQGFSYGYMCTALLSADNTVKIILFQQNAQVCRHQKTRSFNSGRPAI
jgi:hypothetical protein